MRSSILRLPSDNFGSDNPTATFSAGVEGEESGVKSADMVISEVVVQQHDVGGHQLREIPFISTETKLCHTRFAQWLKKKKEYSPIDKSVSRCKDIVLQP